MASRAATTSRVRPCESIQVESFDSVLRGLPRERFFVAPIGIIVVRCQPWIKHAMRRRATAFGVQPRDNVNSDGGRPAAFHGRCGVLVTASELTTTAG